MFIRKAKQMKISEKRLIEIIRGFAHCDKGSVCEANIKKYVKTLKEYL